MKKLFWIFAACLTLLACESGTSANPDQPEKIVVLFEDSSPFLRVSIDTAGEYMSHGYASTGNTSVVVCQDYAKINPKYFKGLHALMQNENTQSATVAYYYDKKGKIIDSARVKIETTADSKGLDKIFECPLSDSVPRIYQAQ